jgi:Flp pilus assembly protein TadD
LEGVAGCHALEAAVLTELGADDAARDCVQRLVALEPAAASGASNTKMFHPSIGFNI